MDKTAFIFGLLAGFLIFPLLHLLGYKNGTSEWFIAGLILAIIGGTIMGLLVATVRLIKRKRQEKQKI
jgi:Na+-driven multidrug efflux pump